MKKFLPLILILIVLSVFLSCKPCGCEGKFIGRVADFQIAHNGIMVITLDNGKKVSSRYYRREIATGDSVFHREGRGVFWKGEVNED